MLSIIEAQLNLPDAYIKKGVVVLFAHKLITVYDFLTKEIKTFNFYSAELLVN